MKALTTAWRRVLAAAAGVALAGAFAPLGWWWLAPICVATLVWLWLTNLTLLMGVELDAALELGREAEGSTGP